MNNSELEKLPFGCQSTPVDKSLFRGLFGHDQPVILDIGCYDGRDSFEFATLFPRASIYAFEADYRSVALFKQIAPKQKRGVKLIEQAVGAADGEVSWYPSDSTTRRHYGSQECWSASSSLQPPREHLAVFPDVHFKPPVTVPCTRLDSWVDAELPRGGRIDLLWVDVNGGEGKVLTGGKHTFSQRVGLVYIEFCVRELYEGSLNYEGMLTALADFTPLGVYDFLGNFGSVLLRNDAIAALNPGRCAHE